MTDGRSHSTLFVSGTLLVFGALGASAETTEPAADFAQRSKELAVRIAALEQIDALQPQALEARIDYARLLHQAASADCLPQLATAEQVLTPVLNAGASATLAWPDGPGDALSLMQTIQNSQGQCADNDAAASAAFESAIATGQRAVELLRENWDFEEMAIAQFNVAFARYELGDLDGALRDLEQVLEWDQEFGFLDELKADYATWLRWRNGGQEPDANQVDRFVASFNQTKARFEFAWKPHRSRWSTEAFRANLKNGVFGEVTTRYATQVDVRRDGADWVVATSLDATPTFEASGAAAGGNTSEQLQGLVAGLTASLPEVVVGTDGSFKSLRNLEQHRSNLLREVKRLIAETAPAGGTGPAAAEVERVMDAILNPELLTTIAAGQWDIAVGAWIGGEFDHGDWYSLTFEEPLPGFSDKPVSKTMNFKVSRWLPCGPGRPPECVEVLVKISPDSESLSQAIADFIGRLMPAASRADMEKALLSVDYEFDMRYRLVTEPDTLRPWSLEERKYIYASSIEGGKRHAQSRRDRTVETGQYPD